MITGASSGIGEKIAIEVAKQGGNVVLIARRLDKLQLLAQQLEETYQIRSLVLAKDLTYSQDIESAVEETLLHFGQIDYLINSSGMGIFKQATEFEYQEIDQLFKINTHAMMYLSELVARNMILQNIQGHIMMISSVAGKIATPSSSVYSASKFAVIGFANSLRLELKRFGINVTTINPGPVKTEFFSHDESSLAYYERIKKVSLNPDKLAQDIVYHMKPGRRKREINRPRFFNVVDKFYQLFPLIGDYLASDVLNFKEDK